MKMNSLFSLPPFTGTHTHIKGCKDGHVDFMEGDKWLEINNSPFNTWVELCFPPFSSRSSSLSSQTSLQFLKWINSCNHCISFTYDFVGTRTDQKYISWTGLYWKILVCLFTQLLQFPWKLTFRKTLIWWKFSTPRKKTNKQNMKNKKIPNILKNSEFKVFIFKYFFQIFVVDYKLFFQNHRWNVMELLKQRRLIRKWDNSSLGNEGLYPNSKSNMISIIWKKTSQNKAFFGDLQVTQMFLSTLLPSFNQVSGSSFLFPFLSPLHTPSFFCNAVNAGESLRHPHCWMNNTFYKAVDSSWCFTGFLWRRDLFFF